MRTVRIRTARVERTLLSAAFDIDFDFDPRTPGRNEFQELRKKLAFALCFWVAQRFTAAIRGMFLHASFSR